MKKRFLQLPEGLSDQARNAFLIITAFFCATFLVGIPILVQLIKASSSQLWAAEISVLGVTIASGIALWLARRGRFEAGIWLTISSALLTGFVLAATFSGLGILFFVGSATLYPLIALQTLQRRQATALIITGLAASVLMLLVDLFIPIQRLSIPGFQTLFYVTAGGLLLLFVYFIFRQFRRYAFRTKLIISFVAVTLISISIIGFIAISISSARISEGVGSNLSAISASLAKGVSETIDNDMNLLVSLSLNKSLQDEVVSANAAGTSDQGVMNRLDQQWKSASDNDPLLTGVLKNNLAEELVEFQAKFPEFAEIFVTDKYGAIVASTNRTSDYYQADEEWWQAAWSGGKGGVYVSQVVFDESTNTDGIDFAIPVLTHNGNTPAGVLRATLNLSKFADLIASTKVGQTGRADLIFSDNQTLTAETGFDKLSPEDAVSLSTLPEPYGRITYEGDPSLASKTMVVAPLSQNQDAIERLGWSVIVHQHITEAQAPITVATRSIALAAIVFAIAISILAQFLAQLLVDPITRLTTVANQVTAGDLKARADVEVNDEIGVLATAFNMMTKQLRDLVGSLEERIAARTRNLELAAEVGRSVSQVHDLDVMLKDACELILKEFNLYYVQVYLTDPGRTTLTLEAGTGEVGVQLIGRGHSLPLNTTSINGRAAVEKHPVVISDTTQSTTFRQNPLLPDTRGEMAVPLIVANKVMGVLDMQSNAPGVLSEEVLPAFEALAGQLAVAIQNANLLEETNEARAEVEKQARHLVRESWSEHLDAIHKPEQIGFVYDHRGIIPLAELNKSPVPENSNSITSSISITGEPLGSLVVEMDDASREDQAVELVNVVAHQVAQQIENLRLLENAERYRHEAEEAARRTTVEGWKQYIESRKDGEIGYIYDTREVRPLKDEPEDPAVTLSIKTHDQAIGKLAILGLEEQDTVALELANAVIERLGDHIEGLRLSRQTMERAQRERILRQITSAVRASNNAESILRTAVRELGNMLGRKTIVRVKTQEEVQQPESNNGHESTAATDPSVEA